MFPIEETFTVHYTACSKPWQCRYSEQDPSDAIMATTNATTCGLLTREFFKIRKNLENDLQSVLQSPITTATFTEKQLFHPELFLGYCGTQAGKRVYAEMDGFPEQFEMKELYGF